MKKRGRATKECNPFGIDQNGEVGRVIEIYDCFLNYKSTESEVTTGVIKCLTEEQRNNTLRQKELWNSSVADREQRNTPDTRSRNCTVFMT